MKKTLSPVPASKASLEEKSRFEAPLTKAVNKVIAERTPDELALGWLRYEALRKLNPRQYGELHARNLAGENFDAMVTAIVAKGK